MAGDNRIGAPSLNGDVFITSETPSATVQYLGSSAMGGNAVVTDEIEAFNDALAERIRSDPSFASLALDCVTIIDGLPRLDNQLSFKAANPDITKKSRKRTLFNLYTRGLLRSDNIRPLLKDLDSAFTIGTDTLDKLQPGETVLISILNKNYDYDRPRYIAIKITGADVVMVQGGETITNDTIFNPLQHLDAGLKLSVVSPDDSTDTIPREITITRPIRFIDKPEDEVTSLLIKFDMSSSMAIPLLNLLKEYFILYPHLSRHENYSNATQRASNVLVRDAITQGISVLPNFDYIEPSTLVSALKDTQEEMFDELDTNVARCLALRSGEQQYVRDTVTCRRWVYQMARQQYPHLKEPELSLEFTKLLATYVDRGATLLAGVESKDPKIDIF